MALKEDVDSIFIVFNESDRILRQSIDAYIEKQASEELRSKQEVIQKYDREIEHIRKVGPFFSECRRRERINMKKSHMKPLLRKLRHHTKKIKLTITTDLLAIKILEVQYYSKLTASFPQPIKDKKNTIL